LCPLERSGSHCFQISFCEFSDSEFDIFFDSFFREEESRLSPNNAFLIASLIHGDYGDAACHRLYRDHTEVFILRDGDSGKRSLNNIWKVFIVGQYPKLYILTSFSKRKEFCPLWIISAIDDEEFFIGHFLESLDNHINPFCMRKARK
jgi:hypothetical protein